jgi:hypothetical protein
MPESQKFTDCHVTQYETPSADARFYANQRFKVLGAFLITTGLIANATVRHPSIIWGILGFILSYLCLAWEKRTTQWWAILFERLKSLERLAIDEGKMI